MAHFTPEEAHKYNVERTLEAVRGMFPIEGVRHSVHVENPRVVDEGGHEDIAAQYKAKVAGETWGAPVMGTVVVKEKETGKEVSRHEAQLAILPKITPRHSYLIKGQEVQMDAQWQLKPGVYVRRDTQNKLEAQINSAGRTRMNLTFDPESRVFHADVAGRHIPLYPLLQALGHSDHELEQSWGKDILQANQQARNTKGALERFYGALNDKPAPPDTNYRDYLRDALTKSLVRPEATKLTLGTPHAHLGGSLLADTTKKMIAVYNGAPEDDRDAIVFKDLRSTGDFLHDAIRGAKRTIVQKVQRKLNTSVRPTARGLWKGDFLQDPILDTFDTSLARVASQINPLEMTAASFQTTLLGPGGIQSERGITDEAKMINASHFGYLDPLHSPEGSRTGVTLRLPIGVRKEGREAKIHLYNTRTNKMELVDPVMAYSSNVAMPDTVGWKDGKPHALGEQVTMMGAGNKIIKGTLADAHYVMPQASQAFGLTANLVPFMSSDSPGRVNMGVRHMEQSISLKHREAPLVQVSSGKETFNELLGQRASHRSRVAGTVTAITPHGITVKDADGKLHEHALYNHYPLNDPKGVLHAEPPAVKVGDKVSPGSLLADSNFSRDGKLALGKNLNVAWVPFHGLSFEDGIVVSESAAKKLTSLHMHKPELRIQEGMTLDPKTFVMQHQTAYRQDQLGHIGSDGVVKVGTKIRPGDPLILATKPFDLKDGIGKTAVHRAMMGTHADKSVRWDSEHPGEVVAVHKGEKGIVVHVRTEEALQVGDKLSNSHGGKGICYAPDTDVLTEEGWMPFPELKKGVRIATLNPRGEIEYQMPTRYIEQDHSGPMYLFESVALNLCTTPEHDLYVRSTSSKQYRLRPAKECFGKQLVHLRTGTWHGEERATFTVPGRPKTPGTKQREEFSAPREYPMDLFLEFFGYWLTEGSASSGVIHVAQTRDKHPEVYCKIMRCLQLLGYDPKPHDTVISFGDVRLAAWLEQFGLSQDKFLPREFLELSVRQLRILTEALVDGDGGVYSNKDRAPGKPTCRNTLVLGEDKPKHQRQELFTRSPRLANDYQELALKLGLCASVHAQSRESGVDYIVRLSHQKEKYSLLDPRIKSRREEWVQYEGKVYCVEVPNHVIYVRRRGTPVWCGNCSRILPDSQMPRTKEGKVMDVLLNPVGVAARMNLGTIYEAQLGKVAQKTGKPIKVQNFLPAADMHALVKAELQKHGVSDQEELFDPQGRSMGKVTTGVPHMFKLVHQLEKKTSARAGMTLPGGPGKEGYDRDLQPVSGGHHGGQNLGSLGMYALLAHGATALIRESQTWKGEGSDPESNPAKKWPSQHAQVWAALQTGAPLPPPKAPFIFSKFTDMLRAAGVNVEKKGHEFVATPMTDKHILALAPSALPNPHLAVVQKANQGVVDLHPEKGGLFDEKLTGGIGGRQWSHIKLAEPIANPLFEMPIRHLTGLKDKEYEGLCHGTLGVSPAGRIVPVTEKGAVTGGEGFKRLLAPIDPVRDLEATRKALEAAPASRKDALLKKAKVLRALGEMGMRPEEAYVLHHLPVLPPALRPLAMLPGTGDVRFEDINGLYKSLGLQNSKLGETKGKGFMPDEMLSGLRKGVYEGARSIIGYGIPYDQAKYKGLFHQIAGRSPKEGLFQAGMTQKRLDLSMRTTIVPEPSLGLDEIMLPRHEALTTYAPFVVRGLVQAGFAKNEAAAQGHIASTLKGKEAPGVWSVLEKEMAARPVAVKRDPVLHKYGIQGFHARLAPKGVNAIQIHPLVCGGFNADFDGDSCQGTVFLDMLG